MKPADNTPWYREPWPWLLMAGPAAVVLAGAVTMALAVRSDDGLVADDYYRQGLTINRVLARDARARSLGLSASAELTGDVLTLRLSNAPAAAALRLRFTHATRSAQDREALLVRSAPGVYSGRLPADAKGARLLVLEDVESLWRLVGRWDARHVHAELLPAS